MSITITACLTRLGNDLILFCAIPKESDQVNPRDRTAWMERMGDATEEGLATARASLLRWAHTEQEQAQIRALRIPDDQDLGSGGCCRFAMLPRVAPAAPEEDEEPFGPMTLEQSRIMEMANMLMGER